MENKEDIIDPDYKGKFNVGYFYARAYPKISLKILEQNKSTLNAGQSLSALLTGMQESIRENEINRDQAALEDIDSIRNQQDVDRVPDIER